MKKIIFSTLATFTLILGLVITSQIAFAQSNSNTPSSGRLECNFLPQSVCDRAITASADANNPAGGFAVIVNWAANIIVGIFGLVAVLIIIASAVQISASAGNENAVKQAKENIFKVVTALVLLISFRAILELVQGLFTGVNTVTLFNGEGLAAGGIPALFANAISIASFAAGVVSLIFIVIGGIRYTTSGGNSNALTAAKKTIIYAISGLVLSISAYGILVFISSQLIQNK